jgi:Domain of unknown function (DUF4386)
MDSFFDGSPGRTARIAGVLYLINILGGAFAIGFVPAILFSPDLAATAHNIQTHELLYRSGLVAHLLVAVTNVPLALLFFDLFKVVNRKLALLDVFFTLVGTAIEAAGLLNQFTPLVLLGSGHSTGVLSAIDYDIYTVFYCFDIVCVGYLVFRSTFLPRVIGVLLAIDGLAYLVHSFTDVLAPGFAAHLAPLTDLAPLLGEGSLCLWLLIVGVDAERWKKRAVQGPADLRPPDQPRVAALD